ncbi:RpiB/LacA/LacB family sugar-phosphate isomerase [Candidatus Micrarchaeota archaeon]|nr:RpiB/LacA/LacB family sugar-phosphate isomerase [Candidatus Micrarchaeota archaeon]
MKVFIGADHAGFGLKEQLKAKLRKRYDVVDLSPVFLPGDDYPDIAAKVARKVVKGNRGILICGSSTGVCIAANKVKGIRAVQGLNEAVARFSREREDANIICLSGGKTRNLLERKKFKSTALSPAKAAKIVLVWLKTRFAGLSRDKRRLKKIAALA